MTETYELEIDIDAPRDRVWRALVASREVEAWFAEHADVSLEEGRFAAWGRFVQGNPTREQGTSRVLDYELHKRLHFEMPYGGATSDVEIVLDGDTTLRVVHSNVVKAPPSSQLSPRHLWSGSLEHLRGWIEQGDPGPRFDYTWPTTGGFEVTADIPASPSVVMEQLDPNRCGWRHEEHRRPARNDDEDFAWDVGVEVGIKVLDVVPDERLTLAWIQESTTTLTYSMEPTGRGTHLTLVHSGFGADTDEQGMAEGFFSGFVELYWALKTGETWPPHATRLETPWPQSGWRFGVRVLQSSGS